MRLHFSFDPFPVLSTPRLILREVHDSDIPEIFFLRSDEEVMKYTGKPLAKNYDEILKYIQDQHAARARKKSILWAITLKGDPQVIGLIGYRQFTKEHFRGEVGYGLYPAHQHNGIMHEALNVVLDYGFHTIGLHSVEANVDKENLASIRLLERNNFTREAHFKENYYFNGRFIDSVIYSLLAPTKTEHAEHQLHSLSQINNRPANITAVHQ
jgi:ribosomal-protein-alanine N-acetyltransferase